MASFLARTSDINSSGLQNKTHIGNGMYEDPNTYFSSHNPHANAGVSGHPCLTQAPAPPKGQFRETNRRCFAKYTCRADAVFVLLALRLLVCRLGLVIDGSVSCFLV